MNLIDEQIIGLEPLDSIPDCKVLIIIHGNDCCNAIKSIQTQLYTDFEVICIRNDFFSTISEKIDINQVKIVDALETIKIALEKTDAEYVYMMDCHDILPANALLEYVKCIEKQTLPDLIYADEAFQNGLENEELEYKIKPFPSNIAFFQSLFVGTALIWKKNLLKDIICKATHKKLEPLCQELFLLSMLNNSRVIKLPKILLIRTKRENKELLDNSIRKLLQKNIHMHTNWQGTIGKTSSYGKHCFELFTDQIDILSKTGFIIIENNLTRTLQLLSQLSILKNLNEIIIAAWEQDKKNIMQFCASNNLSNVNVIIRNKIYVNTLSEVFDISKSPYQIILNDWVQWVNRMNLERLIKSFYKPEVMIAVPQVATEGDHPMIVYAGAGINNLSLNGTYFKGRKQTPQGIYDMAWINYAVSMLTPYCIAIRKEVLKKILPFHPTVSTAQDLANELSFQCLEKNIICEFCAQSSVWVKKEVGLFGRRQFETGEIYLKDLDIHPRLSGNYWHFLVDYGHLIEEKKLDIPYLMRSCNQYIKEEFQAFGLNKLEITDKKRVLVLTHELSLTGAPLVLVQAVKTLIKFNYDVIVVSPEDGPLRQTYLEMNVPVIIEPQLQQDFSYMDIVYDFNFILVSTIVLWQCIEMLGNTSVPVLWWIHDSRVGYENYLKYVLPETIGKNIHLYCGGSYAQNVIEEFRAQYHSSILLYGVEDFSVQLSQTVDRNYWHLPDEKVIFANIGQISKRKGQDILCKAIRRLPYEIIKECIFVFVGSVVDRAVYSEIAELQVIYPENIIYIEQMPYNLLKEFYREIDGVICSSIDDPLPAFVTEALLMSKICICSSKTAFSSLIISGKNGYLFESSNTEKLSFLIRYVIEHPKEQIEIRKNARLLYENNFTPQIFERNFLKIVENITNGEEYDF